MGESSASRIKGRVRDWYNILQEKINKEPSGHEWRKRRQRRDNGPPSSFRMEEQRKRQRRPQSAVDERRIRFHLEREMREERSAREKVERELQRARDRRALDAFRKSYAARAKSAFHQRRRDKTTAPPPPLGLGNFISRPPSRTPLCRCKAQFSSRSPAVKKGPLRHARKRKRNLELLELVSRCWL